MSLDSAISSLVSRLEGVASRLEKVEHQLASGPAPSAGGSGGGSGDGSASVRDYDNLINDYIRPLVAKSGSIDPEVAEQANLLLKAVEAQKNFLAVAASSKKPSDQVLQGLIAPTSEVMGQVVSFRDARRTSKFFNNLSTISEGIGALGWVMVSPTPGPHVADMRGGSEFYSNRILKDFKGKDQSQVDWVQSFNTFLKELQNFIKNHHTTGLSWNPQGGDASSAKVGGGGASSAAKPSAGGPPPPPAGGPPPPAGGPPAASSAAKGADMNALFGALNKGTDVTSGLKKVTNDMKSKNRKDEPPVQPVKASSGPKTSAKDIPKKPSRLELDGNKWIVENFVDRKDIVISETETRHVVYIYGMVNSTVVIKGKVNSIAVDGCKRTAVVLDNAISGVEVVNGTSIEIQVLGKVPSVAVDKTSGIQILLGKESLDAEIVTSKSSEMNIMLPGDGDVDLVEVPIPEQYKTVIKNGKLHTECVQHSG